MQCLYHYSIYKYFLWTTWSSQHIKAEFFSQKCYLWIPCLNDHLPHFSSIYILQEFSWWQNKPINDILTNSINYSHTPSWFNAARDIFIDSKGGKKWNQDPAAYISFSSFQFLYKKAITLIIILLFILNQTEL